MKYSKAPWSVYGNSDWLTVISADQFKVANICHPSHGMTEESRSNADLIAAAPDLLEALETLTSDIFHLPLTELAIKIQAGRAAIQKARGIK